MDMMVSTAAVPKAYANLMAFKINGADRDREFVMDFIEKSTAYKDQFIPLWDEIQDNYFVTPTGQRDRYIWKNRPFYGQGVNGIGAARTRSVMKDPETHQNIEALAAQGMGLLIGTRDYLRVSPVGADDYEKARFLGRILQSILEQPGWFRTHYGLLKNAFTYGTSICELGWETCSRSQMARVPIYNELGVQVGVQDVPQDVVYRDAPMFRELDIYNAYPDPTGTRIHHDMVGFAKRGKMTAMLADKLVQYGTYDNSAVRSAIDRSKSGSKQGGAERWDNELQNRDLPSDFKPLTFFEYWGQTPYRDGKGHNNKVITLLEGEVVRSTVNPYLDGEIPFKEVIVNPVPGRFYGLSPAETVRFLQDSADNMLMVLNDAADAAIRSPLLVGTSFGGDMERLKNRDLLDIIECRNPEAVKPLPVDLSALNYAAQDLQRRKQSMREATGMTNPMQAITSGGRQTATEVSELVRMASQRVEMMIQLIERDDYPWIGRAIHSRLKQFMPPGGGRVFFEGESIDFDLADINFDADVSFSGSRLAMSQFQILQQYNQALTILGANPGVVGQYPDLVVRLMRDGLKILDAETQVARAIKMNQTNQLMGMITSGQGGAGPMTPGAPSVPMGTESESAEMGGIPLA